MLGGAVGEGSPGGEDLLTVTVVRDEHGYGMKVSGDNPVYVQSVKEHGAAWRAGLRAGDRILKVDSVPVHHHTHQQVVHMIRANPSTVLTVQQNLSRHKTPITAPVPVNQEKLRQLEVSKVHTMRLMLEKEQKYMRDLRNELLKVPDVRKQAQLDAAEQRCALLQHEIDNITAGQPEPVTPTTPTTPKLSRKDPEKNANMGFLSGLPRSLSNLTGQSLRNLRQARQKQETPLVRQNSDETHNLKQMLSTRNRIPTTCLDNTPPPLPPRSTERPKRNTMSPVSPLNPLNLMNPMSPMNPSPQIKYKKPNPMHQSMPEDKFLKSSHSLEEEGPQPNSIALQMSYPLVNVPPPPLQNGIQTDNRNAVPILHVRSQSSPEHLDHDLPRTSASGIIPSEKETWVRGTPPPGTPPPPYLNPHPAHLQGNMHTNNQNAQPCIDSQRAIISMEEDDPPSDSSTHSGLFSNLRSVRESKARMAVLINWLLGERRCACASLVLVLTDAYRSAAGAAPHTLRRWAYEIQSTFLMPDAILHLNGVDENMANEIEHVLVNEHDKEELLRNVFRKARRHAKDELAKQLSEFQVKRQVGLSALYAPDDAVLLRCMQDKDQERTVVERLMCQRLSALASAGAGAGAACCAGAASPDAHAALLAALTAAAMCLDCRPASVAAAVGGSRGSFLQRDKLYKQRLKQLSKQHPQPFVVRGHLLQAAALTSLAHCHQCAQVIAGAAPQAYVCAHCRLRVHRACARRVDEGCCIHDADAPHNRISRFMERMHAHAPPGQDSNDKKNRKTSGTAQFLNLERSFRKVEDEPPWDVTLSPSVLGESRREGSTEEHSAPDVDVDNSDNTLREPEKEQSWKSGARGVNRAESCRERDAPRRGKHRNASDPNRLTAHLNHDLEGTPTAPSGSSSSSSLSSRSNESNTVAAEHQGSQSDWSEEEDPLAAQWSDSLPQHIRDTIILSARIRKRQEVIHELIVSEGSHVRWLKVLGVDFLKPLERQPALLPPEELRALFPNLPGVRERHTKLYSELRQVRNEAVNHVVEIRQVAEAMLNTLGESGYAPCLSKFCSGQRMALDSLRERRRKNKELHQFLAGREQLPRCGRLQLRDLLACVWQRLTKYQLLLESILKTTSEDGEDSDSTDDICQLKKALSVAKDVLHSVDTAIRTQENYHRLCTIQDKIEVRTLPEKCGTDFEELRKLDLTTHSLRLEGELALRTDTKKIRVLALMLEDSLVLLQREGEKFILRPLPQTGHNSYITPIIKWDKVLFRPNAAVRNTFFLMNINSIQMHELSANTAAEYANWVKHIQEARLAEARPVAAHAHARSADETATVNVSRNPSDASEKSTSSAPADTGERERERDRISNESDRDRDRISNDRERDRDRVSADREENEKEVEKEKEDKEERVSGEKDGDDEKSPQTPAVGRISTHSGSPPPALQGAVSVRADPVHTARRVLSHHERLRRLDAAIARALLAKSAVVAELLGVPAHNYAHVAELAVADVMGQVDICGELNTSRETEAPDLHQLLLAAQAQANQLTEALSAAMSVSEAAAIAARSGRCDGCRRRCDNNHDQENLDKSSDLSTNESRIVDTSVAMGDIITDSETSFEMLPDYTQNGATEMPLEAHIIQRDTSDFSELNSANGAALATRLAPLAGSLHAALSGALAALPRAHHERRTLRAELSAARDRADRAERRARADYGATEEICPKGVDQSIQDQPSNGG